MLLKMPTQLLRTRDKAMSRIYDDLSYKDSALYKFVHKHRERILKDRTKTPENTALFLLYLGFSLIESAPNKRFYTELQYLIDDTFAAALDILCSENAEEIHQIMRDYSDQLGLTKSKKPKKIDDEDIYRMVLLGKEIFPKKSLEKIYEKIANVTKITKLSKSQVKKKYYSFIQLNKEQTELTLYKARNKSKREVHQNMIRIFEFDITFLSSYKEFFLDMVSCFDEVVEHSHLHYSGFPSKETPSSIQSLMNFDNHLKLYKKSDYPWMIRLSEIGFSERHNEFKRYRDNLRKYYSSQSINKLPSLSYSDDLEAEAVFSNFFLLTKPLKSDR